ncbi:hypothetical protein E4L95_19685 [Paracoccus liaowanqingii]|uniref:Sulfotransferase family protein n=1 Tax=Paracoccus liaowanqingii TaxID=2560053 RepID=A0A4Z1CDQ5_9RHOB|nr:sulfotransferase family 2 domain-containing protein [Paracoccus liaowanqingii]TGN45820.1 hypothetical protein E4L95_19685 [Paracoccus liaowanqingii]
MPFKDLKNMKLDNYIKENANQHSKLIFMHIPKTAGSSFSEAMQKLLSPYKNIEVDYNDNTKSHNEKLSESVNRFIKTSEKEAYRSASGHMPYNLVESLTKSVPECKLVTFLRDPVARVISDYRYQRTPQHPPYREFIEKFPDIESYINHEPAANKLTHFICGLGNKMSAEDAIKTLDEKFSFVGLVEMYPFSYNTIFRLLGYENQFPTDHSRKTPDTPVTKVEINEEIISLIKNNNKLDIEIFEHARGILDPIRREWARAM